MSQHVTIKSRNFEEMKKGNENSYQSVWMAHWTRTDFHPTQQRFDALDNEHGLNHTQIASAKTLTTPEINKENVRGLHLKIQPLPVNFSRLQKDKETRGSQSSYTLSRLREGKQMRGMQEFKPLVDRDAPIHQEKRHTASSCLPKSVAPTTAIFSGLSKSQKSMEKMKAHAFFSDNSYVESGPLQDIAGSETGIILYQSCSGKPIFEIGRSGMSSHMGDHLVNANDQLPSGQVRQLVTQPFPCTIRSPNLLGNSSMKNHASSRKTSTPYHRLGSLKDPSTSANRTSVSNDYHLPLQNFPSFRQLQLPCHGCSPELTRLEMFHDGYSSIGKLPTLAPKVEAQRIGANVDSIAGSFGCFPMFSHSNRSMLITGDTDVRFGKEDVITNVRISSNIDVNAYLSSSSPFLRHGQQGVKIQSLCSSTDSEGNRYPEDSKDSQGNLKNASSAETDAMDMDAFTERCHTSDVNKSSFVKALKSKTMQFSSNRPGTEIGNSQINSELPDTNLELSAANNKIEDPTGRWAKRLKSSATDNPGVGTQSFDLEEVSRNKMKRPSGMFTSELLRVNHKEEHTKADKTNAFPIKNASSSKVAAMKGKNLLLSQSWIQRWLRNEGGSREKQLEALVLCEPQSSKLELDDLQKKQFPSIAAMALMGKAMNGFQPCELQNRGTFVVWN